MRTQVYLLKRWKMTQQMIFTPRVTTCVNKNDEYKKVSVEWLNGTALASLDIKIELIQKLGVQSVICFKKCSNELRTKALVGWKYALIDSTFRIQTVSEWVFQPVIFRSSYFYSVTKMKWWKWAPIIKGTKHDRGQEKCLEWRYRDILQKCRWRKVKWRSTLASPRALLIFSV